MLEAGNVIQRVTKGSKLCERANNVVTDIDMRMSLHHDANINKLVADSVKIIANPLACKYFPFPLGNPAQQLISAEGPVVRYKKIFTALCPICPHPIVIVG